ncbi:MAG TPA: TMEM165/GDT1 family protein [Chloroflexota bacterium]|nr:TMEM165/GDT1 family protein [Chloroflexota bacterium]
MAWSIILTTLATLFVAELGDKTQLAVITLAAKHRDPLSVFIGAAIALVLVTAIGAAGGELITRVIPADLLRRVAAGAFVVMGVLMWFDRL